MVSRVQQNKTCQLSESARRYPFGEFECFEILWNFHCFICKQEYKSHMPSASLCDPTAEGFVIISSKLKPIITGCHSESLNGDEQKAWLQKIS